MEDSFETFGEELGPLRADPAPPRPLRQTRRPEAYAPRKIREEMIPSPPPLKPEFKNPTRDLNSMRTVAPPAAPSVSLNEKPWESVTLNRCLFVAITILVLTSGFQRLHATLRGQRPAEDDEDDSVRVRCSTSLRNRARLELPENSLWEVMFEWLPDFSDDDEEEEDDDDEEYEDGNGGIKQKKPRSKGRASSGLRNKPIPNKTLMKQRDKPKRRAAKKQKTEDIAEKKDKHEPDDIDEEDETEAMD